jgi:hypothetical protein
MQTPPLQLTSLVGALEIDNAAFALEDVATDKTAINMAAAQEQLPTLSELMS